MSGVASGRCGVKDTTEDYRSIDVRHWKRDGLLVPGRAFSWQWSRRGEVIASIWARSEPDRVILAYKHRHRGEGWKDESYPVYLEWTSCHLGGERPWFRCPARGCGRRVAILYGAGLFACRDCYQLAYPCQREPSGERAARRANRIREKLGWDPGVLNGDGGKPKGMHWHTFERLTAQQAACANASLADLSIKLGLL